VDEAIMIGDDIEVTVASVKGGKVRLVVKAPKDVVVDRKEIYLEKKAGKEAANADDSSEG
jgi:carbon storage regulator